MKQRFEANKNIKKERNKRRKKKKWATFTFFGSETRTITKLFMNTDIAISYRTKNNIKHVLKTKKKNKKEHK
jgi:predicted nucleotidyltransferase